MNEPDIGVAVKLVKFPPNRSIMDWDRVLHLGQIGYIDSLHAEKKQEPLYAVWFSSKNKREGWLVWLAREHFETKGAN